MKWHEDQEIRSWLQSAGLNEEETGRWTGDNRIFQDFDGGMAMTTVALKHDPRFDVVTIHKAEEGESPMSFMARCLREHTAEIIRKTEILREKGLSAVKDKDLPS